MSATRSAHALLQSLPPSADEQLRLGIRVIELAYEEKARALEQEVMTLRNYSKERQSMVKELERRVSDLETQVQQGEQRARELASENASLSSENATLLSEAKSLKERVSKLDAFKRSIMGALQEDDLPSSAYGGVSGGPKPYSSCCADSAKVYASSMAAGMHHAMPPAAATSPLSLSQGGTCSPPSETMGSSEATGAAGKDFFKQARLRLTYDQFNQFLANIKRLNDHAQSRDETLAHAQAIFGSENHDLFVAFKSLLTKHGLT